MDGMNNTIAAKPQVNKVKIQYHRKNHQYSERRARPVNVAYFLKQIPKASEKPTSFALFTGIEGHCCVLSIAATSGTCMAGSQFDIVSFQT